MCDSSVTHPLSADRCCADVCWRCAVVLDANPHPGRAPPSRLAHSAVDSGARCAPSRQTLVPQSLAAAIDCALPTRKPDRYWSAPRAGESPLISGPEIGYLEKTGQVL